MRWSVQFWKKANIIRCDYDRKRWFCKIKNIRRESEWDGECEKLWYNHLMIEEKSRKNPWESRLSLDKWLSADARGQGQPLAAAPCENYLPVWILFKHWVDKQRTVFNLLTRRTVLWRSDSLRTIIVRNIMNSWWWWRWTHFLTVARELTLRENKFCYWKGFRDENLLLGTKLGSKKLNFFEHRKALIYNIAITMTEALCH